MYITIIRDPGSCSPTRYAAKASACAFGRTREASHSHANDTNWNATTAISTRGSRTPPNHSPAASTASAVAVSRAASAISGARLHYRRRRRADHHAGA